MLIQVGSNETLLDDATRLAARAGAADVAVTLEIWPHMIHAWPLWNAHLEDGRRALARGHSFGRIFDALPLQSSAFVNRRDYAVGKRCSFCHSERSEESLISSMLTSMRANHYSEILRIRSG